VYVYGLSECGTKQVSEKAAALQLTRANASSLMKTKLDAVNTIIEREAIGKPIDQKQVVECMLCYAKLLAIMIINGTILVLKCIRWQQCW